MKKISLFFIVIIMATNFAFSQGTAINNSGAAADNSAILDVSSTTQGLLIPRMTETNRVGIASPATGLMVYQTDVVKGFYYYTGSAWTYIGSDNLGNHTATDSLDMANHKIKNLTTCTANYDAANKLYVDNKVGAGGGGGTNMPTMMSDESPSGTPLNFRQAADYCRNLTEGAFTDWYMPTWEEFWYVVSNTDSPIPNSSSSNNLWIRRADYRAGYPHYHTYLRLSDSYSGSTYNSEQLYFLVRCVR